ncbi:TPA: glycosyltransferase family A protein [Vibrio cholerae]
MSLKIDVCIPTYNRPRDLDTLVNSIPNDIGIWISNNGSYISNSDFKRHVNIINNENLIPMFDNWNNAVSRSDADFVFITSDDDIYFDGAFEVVKKAIKKNPNIGVFIWGCNFVNESYETIKTIKQVGEDTVLGNEDAFNKHSYSVDVRMPSFCISRELFLRIGGFPTEMTLTASDSCLVQKALLSGDVYFGKEIISGYRVWSNSLTSQRNATKQWFEELDMWISEILSFAKLHDLEKIIPADYREKIMYQNIRSAISTMKENARGRKEQLHFLMDLVKDGYSKNIFHILKSIAVILFKK